MKRVVAIVSAGTVLSVAGCTMFRPDNTQTNPPVAIEDDLVKPPQPERIINPPPVEIPTWDEVTSGHPEGATNPPTPLLVINENGTSCYKIWLGQALSEDDLAAIRAGGRILAAGETPEDGTFIECPQEMVDALLNPEANAPK